MAENLNELRGAKVEDGLDKRKHDSMLACGKDEIRLRGGMMS